MANHGLTDLVATVALPKTEYEELVRASERMKIVTQTLENVDEETPCELLKRVLGMRGKDETKIIAHTTDNESIVIKES